MKCHLLITPTLLDLRLIYPTYLASMSCGSNKVVCHELHVAHVSGGKKEARIGQRSCIGGLFTWRWRSDLSKAVPSDPLLQLTPPVPTSVTPCTSRGTNWIRWNCCNSVAFEMRTAGGWHCGSWRFVCVSFWCRHRLICISFRIAFPTFTRPAPSAVENHANCRGQVHNEKQEHFESKYELFFF